jgi:hypothetical protein
MPTTTEVRTVIVNGIVYGVLSSTQDRQGELLCIRRPKGRKCYAARPILDTTYGADRAFIVANLGDSR